MWAVRVLLQYLLFQNSSVLRTGTLACGLTDPNIYLFFDRHTPDRLQTLALTSIPGDLLSPSVRLTASQLFGLLLHDTSSDHGTIAEFAFE